MTLLKHISSVTALLLAVVSCAKQANVDVPNPDTREEGRNLSLSRECFVKSTLDANKAKWTIGDQVAVYQKESEAPKKFIATENGTLSKFSLHEGETALDVTGNYFLVYPYSAVGDSKLTSNSVSLSIPAEQTAVLSSFDPAAAVAVAQGSDYKEPFVFKNAHALFKVTIPDAFGAEIAQIRLSSNNEDEKIAGICTVAFNEQIPAITAGDGAVAKVVLSGKDGAVLTPGDYYIATAPVTVLNGICAELIGTDGRVYFRYSTKEKEFKQNTIYDLGVTVQKAGTDIVLDSKYYTEGETYVYGGRENLFPATVSGVSNAAFTSLPEGWNARLESNALVVVPSTDSEAGVYEIQLLAYAEGARAEIYTFKFKYDPSLILFDDFDGTDIDDRYWKRYNEGNSTLWNWFQTGDAAQSAVADGKLQLKAVYEGGTYKTGAVTGKDKLDYETPFRVDCRASMSRRATGFWCAIWTVPTTGYQDGEIDIMEAGDHYSDATFASTAQYTCHNQYTLNTPSKRYDGWRPGQDQPQSAKVSLDDPTGYHTYSVEVTDEAITWYVDDVQVHRYANIKHSTSDRGYKYAAESTVNSAGNTIYPKANYFNNYTFIDHNYFAIFDIAVGGSFVGGENDKAKVPATEGFNAQFDIDWIKISKIK